MRKVELICIPLLFTIGTSIMFGRICLVKYTKISIHNLFYFPLMQGYNPLHLACFGGHIVVVGLLLSRSADLLHSADRHGKTGLHIAATHGHYQMVEVLLGQGAEINTTDKVCISTTTCKFKYFFSLQCQRIWVLILVKTSNWRRFLCAGLED